MALVAAVAAPPAGAQTATSTSGNVGSAASRNGYPAGGGAIVLPAPSASGNATTAAGATPASGAGSGATNSGGAAGASANGSGGSGGQGRTGTASAGGAARSSGGGGAHWVLCPPTGSSGLSPLFTGTDLSCTPD